MKKESIRGRHKLSVSGVQISSRFSYGMILQILRHLGFGPGEEALNRDGSVPREVLSFFSSEPQLLRNRTWG